MPTGSKAKEEKIQQTMEISQEKIDKIRWYAKTFAIIFSAIAIVLFVVFEILQNWEDEDWYLMAAFMIGFVANAMGGLSIISLFTLIFIDFRNADASKRRRIAELENSVRDLEFKREQTKKNSPLSNLSDKQQSIIEDFLHELPSHNTKDYAINMKEWARFIRALTDLKYISVVDSLDTKRLRKWVEMVSGGKDVPGASQFNEAIRDATQGNVEKAKETIIKLLN